MGGIDGVSRCGGGLRRNERRTWSTATWMGREMMGMMGREDSESGGC